MQNHWTGKEGAQRLHAAGDGTVPLGWGANPREGSVSSFLQLV